MPGPHATVPAMSPFSHARPNILTGSPLDRASLRRDDDAWVDARRADPASLFLLLWRSESLVWDDAGVVRAALLSGAEAAALSESHDWAFLGLLGGDWPQGRAVFAVDLGSDEDKPPVLPRADLRFADLRSVAAMAEPSEAAVLGHARGLLHWRARHRFCGVCGGHCVPTSAGNTARCTQCGTSHFPRTDPAVIMLVERHGRVLLGHANRFPGNMYSTLAGFVEPGESLEEAVAREVREETGVLVGAVRYHSSQPWPFPASLMLGFHAEGLTEEITPEPGELRDARWFSRAELRDPDAAGIALPGRISIARRLIEDWMEQA
jgi:NAD+ diphosphatase